MHSVQKNTDAGSVKTASKHIYWLLTLVALVVMGDEWIKYEALRQLPDEGSLVDPGLLAFGIHRNFGIAFNLPFRLELIIAVSILIGVGLLHISYKNYERQPKITFATIMIVLGALGNMYDRLTYGFTVDYIILFGRSAINFSDVVIVSGVVLLHVHSRQKRRDGLKRQVDIE